MCDEAGIYRGKYRPAFSTHKFLLYLANASTSWVYSSSESVTSSGIPAASTREAPTLEAILAPRRVTIGTPAHSASQPTVCAL